ncbi:hypothetical protein K461DRAFT_291178 [Myriangium duriaei CBS 260.36]|uniref:Uncharacterized protein n=1 Tax=Myriangium duriaei CBS 260.36 TaxID=1168546 RepID=A0A9P4MIQ7_9PEZI|nr:hypothetical protein K461DRAFT_291178 [Myriangium duriaei CBS 260.36]
MASVHTGTWQLYPANTPVYTTTDSRAFVLVAFISLCIPFAGEALWSLTRQVWIEWLKPAPPSDIYLNRHIYRTIIRPKHPSVWAFVLLLFMPVRKGPRCFRSPLWWALLVVSLICGPGFIGLSIAAPYLITMGTAENPPVLANYSNGKQHLWVSDPSYPNSFQLDAGLNQRVSQAADSYFSSCYQSQYGLGCQSDFVQTKLPYDFMELLDCPFPGDICAKNASNPLYKPFRYFTPWIKFRDLGFNSQYDLQIQKAIDCAPVSSSVFCTNCNGSDPNDPNTYHEFVFGDPEVYSYIFALNSTFAKGYRIYALQSSAGSFQMDPRLVRSDGATTLIFLSAPGVNYIQPISDPIFLADDPVSFLGVEYFQSHYWVTALGCVDQMRLSNNRTGMVTPWVAPDKLLTYTSLFTNLQEQFMGLILGWSVSKLTAYNIIAGRGPSALQVSRSLNDLIQVEISQNQTRIEVGAIFGTSLSKLQLMVKGIGNGDDGFNSTGFTDLLASPNLTAFRELGSVVTFKAGQYTTMYVNGIWVSCVLPLLLWGIMRLVSKYMWKVDDSDIPEHATPSDHLNARAPRTHAASAFNTTSRTPVPAVQDSQAAAHDVHTHELGTPTSSGRTESSSRPDGQSPVAKPNASSTSTLNGSHESPLASGNTSHSLGSPSPQSADAARPSDISHRTGSTTASTSESMTAPSSRRQYLDTATSTTSSMQRLHGGTLAPPSSHGGNRTDGGR